MKAAATIMPYPIARQVLLPMFSLWIKSIEGQQHIPASGPFLAVANHASYLDHPFMVAALLPVVERKVHFLAKREHFDTPLKSWWHRYAGAIPLDRATGGKEGLDAGLKILAEGGILAMHPEGTRSRTGNLLKAKTGAAWLALHTGVPVLPMGLIGTFEILPKGRYLPAFSRARIVIGPPLRFPKVEQGTKIPKSELQLATTAIMDAIAALCGQQYPGRQS